jgi:hypothetical protein
MSRAFWRWFENTLFRGENRMDKRLVELIGQMAVNDALGVPEAEDAHLEAKALCEASGFDWLAIVRWLADNREKISNIVKEATELFQSFPRPAVAAGEASPEAFDPVVIITLITTLMPLIQQMLANWRQRRNPTPAPTPTPTPTV